jgi:disulfide bond formation protein DsbB
MRRRGNLLGFAACAALLGYAGYAQLVLHLEPCPLCIFQRLGIAVLGLLFLAAAVQDPKRWGARLYGLLQLLASLATVGIAARHLWIQHQPEGSVPACGATLSYMLDILPLSTVIRKVLSGSGECARVSWRFLDLSMPAWVLIAAVALGLLAVYINLSPSRSARPAPRRPGAPLPAR